MKKRNAFLAATLSAAMAFSVAPAAVAETANDDSTSISENGTTNTGNDGTDSDNGGDKEKPSKNGKKDEDEEDDSRSLDPNKPMWDKNGASSDPAPEGPFKRDGMNRIAAYFNSNQFKTISMIVSVIAGVITVGSQLAAIVISVSPTAKAQFDNFLKQLG